MMMMKAITMMMTLDDDETTKQKLKKEEKCFPALELCVSNIRRERSGLVIQSPGR